MDVKCLCCEKTLRYDDDTKLVYDGGFIQISFHYGSSHDQCDGRLSNFPIINLIDRLLSSDKIEAYICDECFKKKMGLMRGFNLTPVQKVEINEIETTKDFKRIEATCDGLRWVWDHNGKEWLIDNTRCKVPAKTSYKQPNWKPE